MAGHLHIPVTELQSRIDSKEFSKWKIYHEQIEPIGASRTDIGSAIVACTIANAWSNKRHKVNDFMPNFSKPQEKGKKQSTEDMKKLLDSIARPAKKEKINNGKYSSS